MNATVLMRDLTGDGLPDHILKTTFSNDIKLKRNIMGKVGLLKNIHTPLGGRIELSYEASSLSVADPRFRWNLESVTHHAQLNEEDDVLSGNELSYETRYEYLGGYYDRLERVFLGYREVERIAADDSKTISTYKNSLIFEKGLLEKQETYDSSDNLLRRQSSEYLLSYQSSPKHIIYRDSRRDYRWGFPRLQSESFESWEPGSLDAITMEKEYEYDSYGNITELEENPPGTDGDLTLIISYRYMRDLYRMSLPARLKVRDNDSNLLRHREGVYDSLGRLTALRIFYDSESSTSRISWNDDGTLSSITDPLGTRTSYDYDDSGLFVTRIDVESSDGEEISSHMAWNRAEGTLRSRTDPNGLPERHDYDDFGRPTAIFGPYDGTIPAVAYEYTSDDYGSLYARSANKISLDPDDEELMYTLIKIDGLGRPIYTAKTGFIAHVDREGGELGWNVSGAVSYDEKGRVVKEGRPSFQAADGLPTAPLLEEGFITQTIYDDLDRPLKTIYPSSNWGDVYSTYQYRIDGETSLSILTDPLSRISETRKNARGQLENLRRKYMDETLAHVDYEYNPLGELLEVRQSNQGEDDYSVRFTYDMRGLQVAQESPERGVVRYRYDERGNLIERSDPNLRAKGKVVRHHYDGFGRISRRDYPESEDVHYFYGDSTKKNINGVGRLIRRRDESGLHEFEYGKMGEVIRERRTLHSQRALHADQIALMSFKSDYLGRMNRI
ncbi:toxin TcdB middle/N-terminal domain-containing protein, partial [Olavius algarvensis spirochete endosymbiont]|uniref:toxin TcdB middle/N-terminal domain-containing protein n=1 Tax=Olavius algarvensis spirochete endosymbiont TaxID=260710 RepID=UPI0027D2EB92